MEKSHGGLMQGPASLLILLGYALWIATVVWCVAAWGAFRQVVRSDTRAGLARRRRSGLRWSAALIGLGRHFG